MDGNGRWASSKGLKRVDGHEEGVNSVRRIIKHCGNIGIEYLTLFSFSEENWNRPKTEILALMRLLVKSLDKELNSLIKNNIQFNIIGDLKKLDIFTRNKLLNVVKLTTDNNGLKLTLAISYGGRQEIISAINKIIKLKINSVKYDDFKNFLFTEDIPDPDLLIRTGNEKRISNFLLWQIAYTEIYFSKLYWPDFNENELDIAINDFISRKRKFGKVL
jgi:undecaprenyl diphosphate synthase